MAYLITGGNGFIGKQLIDRLLKRNQTLYVIVRASSQPKFREIIAVKWPDQQDSIQLLDGDITQALGGLSLETITELKGLVTDLFHLAAVYDMNVDAETARNVNVEGTRHIVDLANTLQCTMHHVSSIAVTGGVYDGNFREDMLDIGQSLMHPYYQTKFDSEALVRDACQVPYRIYRPGAVVGDSRTGEMEKIDGPYYLFELLRLARRMLPAYVPFFWLNAGKLNLVPVDYVADAIDALSHQPGLDGQAFHLVEPNAPDMLKMIKIFAKAAKIPNNVVGVPAGLSLRLLNMFSTMADRQLYVKAFRQGFFDKLGIPVSTMDVFYWKTGFDTSKTESILKPLGITCPPLENYAAELWTYWDQNLRKRKNNTSLIRRKPVAWDGNLIGKRVLITGGSSGIGKALALKVASLGGIVLLVARSQEKLDEVKAQIVQKGGQAFTYRCDLTSDTEVEALFAQLDQEAPVDILVNNAGRSIRRSLSHSYDRFHDFERTMQLNYFGSLRITLGMLERMRAQRNGHIIHVSSVAVPINTPRFSAYAASKAAFDAFCRVAAAESFTDNVHFSSIYMPLVRTPMIAPTQQYESTPALSPDQAAGLIVKTMRKRPARMMNFMSKFMLALRSVAPRYTVKMLNRGYRYTPGTAKKV